MSDVIVVNGSLMGLQDRHFLLLSRSFRPNPVTWEVCDALPCPGVQGPRGPRREGRSSMRRLDAVQTRRNEPPRLYIVRTERDRSSLPPREGQEGRPPGHGRIAPRPRIGIMARRGLCPNVRTY